MNSMSLRSLAAAAFFGMATLSGVSSEYPVSTIHMIVPYNPGGAGDIVGRLAADELGRRLGVTVVVENVPGATGTIGASQVSRAPADGSYLLLAGNAIITTAPHISDPGFDPLNDFTAIANVSEAVRLLAASPSLPVSNFEEFVAYGRENPGELNYAAVGVGSTGHITTVDFLNSVGVEAQLIPYSGSSLAVQALMSGDVQFIIDATAIRHAVEGSVTPLAVPGSQRADELPDIPTLEELGHGDVRGAGLQAIMGPAGMPEEVVEMIETALREALETEEFRETLTRAGVSPRFMSGEELDSALREEHAHVGAMLEQLGVAPQ